MFTTQVPGNKMTVQLVAWSLVLRLTSLPIVLAAKVMSEMPK